MGLCIVQGGPTGRPLADRMAGSGQSHLHDRTSVASLCGNHAAELMTKVRLPEALPGG